MPTKIITAVTEIMTDRKW